jgi:hypothetical protein
MGLDLTTPDDCGCAPLLQQARQIGAGVSCQEGARLSRFDEAGVCGQPDRIPCRGNARHHQTVTALSSVFH